MRGTFMLLAMALASAGAARAAPARLDCTGPVTRKMSAAAILVKFGKDARRENIPGAEGQTSKGVVLYPDDAARRLEITFWDDAQTVVSSISIGNGATGWTGPGGIHRGSSVAEVAAANGGPFELSGFAWDYGGYVTNLRGGKLARLPGGCALQLRFTPADEGHVPDALVGERTLVSTAPLLQKVAPKLDTLTIGWPLPAGVKASDGGAD